MLALAFLTVSRAALDPKPASSTTAGQLIAISVNEIRRLFALLTRPPINEDHILHWSYWRRRHQARARQSHYQRRQLKER
ncbi:hypothetical protein [Nonomuraea sp. NPDC049784]|uniref:hypothetical protein n=1 Tax=Nonomuraea sp. NPDC049784 TaxID=3154361 RepID=UPI0034104F36